MGERIKSYFADGIGRITAFIPELVAALVILAVGYVVSRVLGGLTRRLLERIHFDRFVARRLHPRASERSSASATLGSIVFWIGMVTTFSMTARRLGLDSLSAGLDRVLGFVPHVLVAAVIIGVGIALANVVGQLLGDMVHPTVAKAGRVAILVLAAFMALDQLGIAHGIVMTAFTVVLSAAAVAAAIAFGVGNRQLAGELTRRWVRRAEGDSIGADEARPELPPEIPQHH